MNRSAIFLVIILALVGCTKPEQKAIINIAEQQALINEAKAIVPNNGTNEKIYAILSKIDHLDYELIIKIDLFHIIEMDGSTCSQLRYDHENIKLQINTIKYRIELAGEGASNGLINYYKNHKLDDSSLSEIDKYVVACKKNNSANIIIKPIYISSLKEHEEVNKILKLRYKHEKGVEFIDAWNEIMKLDNEFYRRQNWDRLSPQEKSEASGHNDEVNNCLNAALSSNKDTENIPNIVRDATVLCKKGLGQ